MSNTECLKGSHRQSRYSYFIGMLCLIVLTVSAECLTFQILQHHDQVVNGSQPVMPMPLAVKCLFNLGQG